MGTLLGIKANPQPHKVYVNLDLTPGTNEALHHKIDELNQKRVSYGQPVTLSNLTRDLLGNWLQGHGGPQPRVRLTFDVSWGTYQRLQERLETINTGLPRNARKLTEQRLMRGLLGSWSNSQGE